MVIRQLASLASYRLLPTRAWCCRFKKKKTERDESLLLLIKQLVIPTIPLLHTSVRHVLLAKFQNAVQFQRTCAGIHVCTTLLSLCYVQ
jgi:hypothetical protein